MAGANTKKALLLVKFLMLQVVKQISTLAGVSSGFLGALVGGFIAGALVLGIKNTLCSTFT